MKHALPKAINEMIELIGMECTLKVINTFAGQTLQIPLRAGKQGINKVNSLTAAVKCRETVNQLMRHYGGRSLYIPCCHTARQALRDKQIHDLADIALLEKRSMNSIVSDLAAEFNLSDRRIWEILKKPPLTSAH